MEQFSCTQKGQVRQKDYPARFKSALPHLQQLFSLEKASKDSRLEAPNTGKKKNHKNTDTLSIGTEAPSFAHSQSGSSSGQGGALHI